MSETALLSVRGLTVRIAALTVCRNLDFSVEPGQCWAILGRNGAGKTTLLHTLAGLRPAAAGTIELAGRPLAQWSPRDVARRRAVLPQDDSDAFAATVLETALVGRHPHLSRWQWESAADLAIARAALAAMDIGAAEARDVRTLSGGERRRAEITRALVMSPKFILLDEPFAGIDPIAVTDIQKIIFHLKERGIGVLITDHNVRETLRITDRAYIVTDGTIFRSGTPASLAGDEEVRRIYLGTDFRLD